MVKVIWNYPILEGKKWEEEHGDTGKRILRPLQALSWPICEDIWRRKPASLSDAGLQQVWKDLLFSWNSSMTGNCSRAKSKVMNGLVLTASCSPHCPQHDSPLCSPVAAADTPCDHLLQLHGQAFAVSLHHGHWQEPHSAATTAHTDGDLAIKQYLGEETDTLM